MITIKRKKIKKDAELKTIVSAQLGKLEKNVPGIKSKIDFILRKATIEDTLYRDGKILVNTSNLLLECGLDTDFFAKNGLSIHQKAFIKRIILKQKYGCWDAEVLMETSSPLLPQFTSVFALDLPEEVED